MQTYPQTDYTPNTLWEGCHLPPLRMADEQGRYIPNGFVPLTVSAPGTDSVPPAAARPAAPANSFMRQLSLLLVFGVLCLGAYYIISRFVVTPVVIQGRSMTPTLRDGECYFLNRWIYIFKSPARGDLVVIKDPGHDDFAVKRIIARPGDWLNLKDGKVYLNGERLNESYLPKGTFTATGDSLEKWYQLGVQQYFVMGDNRACSEDSRVYGNILRGNILGAIRN
ncbi:MAG: signal peptidase [Verrucomicrobiota bacterium]